MTNSLLKQKQEEQKQKTNVYPKGQQTHFALHASYDFEPHTWILDFVGEDSSNPHQHSIQIGVFLHRSPPQSSSDFDSLYLWRYLNHSCYPNTYIKGQELYALTQIKKDDELTFNYLSTEWELDVPFQCGCVHHSADRLIRGYRFLSSSEQHQLTLLTPISSHLLALAQTNEEGFQD